VPASPAAAPAAAPVELAGPNLDDPAALDRFVVRCFLSGDYGPAAEALARHVERHPRDASAHYNLACALSRLGQIDRAAESLFNAIEAGFREFNHMKQDVDLEPIRGHEIYLAILEAIERVEAPRRDATPGSMAQLAQSAWRDRFGEEHYHFERDVARKLLYAVALDDRSRERVRSMLALEADHLARTLFDATFDAEVFIAIPTPSHADEWLLEARVGGSYVHAHRTLVSRTIGGNLRHEFCHVMHHAHMDRLQQNHRLWVQEGLATLYEDYELRDAQPIRFLPNERHNVVKRLASMNRLVPWNRLFSMTDDEFMARAEQHYPQVRSIFEFLADEGKLESWYDAYVAHFASDPDGVKAFETAFGESIDSVERRWLGWLNEEPLADLAVTRGDAALGIRADAQLVNDGVRIAEVLPGSAADGLLRVGDIITAIDGVATPESSQLVALIAARRVGERVNLTIRRGAGYEEVPVTLRALDG
jgi:hypothetical protein